jgi:threonine dehydrogenase-like Zn-dependent dehydrogenase
MRALRFTRWSPRAVYAAAAGHWVDEAWAGGRGSPLRLVDVVPPTLPGDDWVRIRVHMAGVCGSDLKVLRVTGLQPVLSGLTDWRAPVIPGHEIVGTVVEAGPRATVQQGTRVVAEPILGCTDKGFEPCVHCRAGRDGLCERAGDAGALVCRRLGAAAFIRGTRTEFVEQARGITGGTLRRPVTGPPLLDRGGFDVVYDCVGSEQTVDDALRVLRSRGELVMVATAGRRRVDWTLVWLRELRISGCVYYGRSPDGVSDLEIAMGVLRDTPTGLVTHRYSLAQATRALRTAAAGPAAHAIKVVFTPS